MVTYTRVRVITPEFYNPSRDEDLATIEQEFKSYWLSGFHENFGKDSPLNRPAAVLDAGMSHVHVLFLDGITPAEEAKWDRNNDPSIAPIRRATCDSMIVYAASEQGTAVLLALYLEEGHKRIGNMSEMARLSSIALEIFKAEREEPLLSSDLMELLQTPTPFD